jgi:hypothetical protein
VSLAHGEQIFYKFDGKMTRGIVVKASSKGNGTWPTIDFGRGYKRMVLVTEGACSSSRRRQGGLGSKRRSACSY